MRRALVVSDAAGTRDVVANEREALVYPIGNVAAFAAAVRRLIEQPALRHDLQIRAYQRVESAFSTHASARQLGACLHEISDRKPAPWGAPGPRAPARGEDGPASETARRRPSWMPPRLAGEKQS